MPNSGLSHEILKLSKRLERNSDTIAAIATGSGSGGIGIVRVSGRAALHISNALIGQKLIPRHATYTSFLDSNGLVIDYGIAIFYPGPNSFTGEDVLELQGHGGSAVLQLLIKSCLLSGSRLAQPGEFTLRAYLNNKLDLLQAESVADLISATSEQAARSAIRSLQGDFSNAIKLLVDALIDLRMSVEATIDFPEEDIDTVGKVRCRNKLKAIRSELDKVIESAKQGSLLREGAHIVLVGQPNVGKSSLLNKLSGEEVALVSEIAGTTRDVIRQEVIINGIPLHIIDTAGLRESNETVERMGIERTKKAMQKADMVLFLTDAHQDIYIDQEILKLIPQDTPRLHVVNKIDLLGTHSRIESFGTKTYVHLSAKTGEGIDLLRDSILRLVGWHSDAGAYMARERHLQALSEARQSLKGAEPNVDQAELFADDLRFAQNALNKITGEFSADDLLGEIFSRFCIGK